MIRRRRRLTLSVAVALAGVAAGTLATTDTGAQSEPPCFGAAARDPATPCSNPDLRFRVIPSPTFAPILPNAPCTPIRSRSQPNVCWFADSRAAAKSSIALLGDSHASAWRGAVAVTARALHAHGLTIRHSSCAFTMATRAAAKSDQKACARWVNSVLRWFVRHPEVHTVFVAASAFAGVVAPPGVQPYDIAIKGARDAFNALPASVQHIIVLRDTPRATNDTLPCVGRAHAHHQRADLRCALKRSSALLSDAAADAALQMDTPRVQVIDLSNFFCDATLCYPVVGGALVFKDISHMTDTFSKTLGPYLLQQYRKLQPAS